jgi:hypothetical protein
VDYAIDVVVAVAGDAAAFVEEVYRLFRVIEEKA